MVAKANKFASIMSTSVDIREQKRLPLVPIEEVTIDGST